MELYNFEFTNHEVHEAIASDTLLSMEIEVSRKCNFRCSYCYVEGEEISDQELSLDEIKDAVLQAKELGAKKIIILGGEPTIYPYLKELIEFLAKKELIIEMFTNGSGIDNDLAVFLAQKHVRVVLKLNSSDQHIQDQLAGKKGAYRLIQRALAHLKNAGYPSYSQFLAISTIICRQNIDELPDMWRWLRNDGIEPYFEIITPQANGKKNTWLHVSTSAVKALFFQLSDIDKHEYGRDWEPQPPLVGNKCLRHQVSCVVTTNGDVFPCVGVTIAIGNIREQNLRDIIQQSEVIHNLKNYRELIKGPCRTCEKASECYGCRGAAYQLTGDYLASDPTCWRNCKE